MFLVEAIRRCHITTGQIIHREHPSRWWTYEKHKDGSHEFIEWPAGIRWRGLGFEDAFSDQWDIVETTSWVIRPCAACAGAAHFLLRTSERVVIQCQRCGNKLADTSAASAVCRWNSTQKDGPNG